MRRVLVLGLGFLAAAGCVDRPSAATVGETDPDGSSSGGPPPTSLSSGEPDTPTGSGTTGTSTGATSSSGDGDSSESSGGDPTVGVMPCGPPCDETWEQRGDITLVSPQSTDELECLAFVSGTLRISGDADVAALAGLRNLRGVTRLEIEDNDVLTDMSPFACVEVVSEALRVVNAPALADASDLAALRSAPSLRFEGTGLSTLPAFAPDFTGVLDVSLRHNPALVDLGALPSWGLLEDAFNIYFDVEDHPSLTSLAGLDALLAETGAPGEDILSVRIVNAPLLTSLVGLETLTHGDLWLQDLPLVMDLEPLSAMTDGGAVSLLRMPKVTTLHGLHNLEHVIHLMIGDCMSGVGGTPGMDGLVDLSGLDELTEVNELAAANNTNLTALTGAPLLWGMNAFDAIENPKLTQAAIDAFIESLTKKPAECIGEWGDCSCSEFHPW